jgi:hypothetical protein
MIVIGPDCAQILWVVKSRHYYAAREWVIRTRNGLSSLHNRQLSSQPGLDHLLLCPGRDARAPTHRGDIGSKHTIETRTRSSIPSFLSCRTTEPRFDRRISGYVCSWRSLLKDSAVYSLKHFPGFVRPARPARWCALARLMGDTSRLSTRCLGLYTFCLEKPGSMT